MGLWPESSTQANLQQLIEKRCDRLQRGTDLVDRMRKTPIGNRPIGGTFDGTRLRPCSDAPVGVTDAAYEDAQLASLDAIARWGKKG